MQHTNICTFRLMECATYNGITFKFGTPNSPLTLLMKGETDSATMDHGCAVPWTGHYEVLESAPLAFQTLNSKRGCASPRVRRTALVVALPGASTGPPDRRGGRARPPPHRRSAASPGGPPARYVVSDTMATRRVGLPAAGG